MGRPRHLLGKSGQGGPIFQPTALELELAANLAIMAKRVGFRSSQFSRVQIEAAKGLAGGIGATD
jgi:hypothetical protein